MTELPISPQAEIEPGVFNQGENYNENVRRANANDQTLADAVSDLTGTPAVRTVTVGTNKLSPDGDGNITLPGGVVAPAMTTTQRNAITNPTVGQLVYNTTTDQAEAYTPSGWRGIGTVLVQVFTASGTWTKPAGARAVEVVCIGGGGAGTWTGAGSSSYVAGGAGGGYGRWLVDASQLAATVPVTVGAGGTGQGAAGGTSTFGRLSVTGGAGGASGNGANAFGGRPQYSPEAISVSGVLTEANPFAGGGTRAGGSGPGGSSAFGGAAGGGANGATAVSTGAGFAPGATGVGLGAPGGAGTYSSGAAVAAGNGSIPGGGGGSLIYASGTPVQGNGARGEVIVTTYF